MIGANTNPAVVDTAVIRTRAITRYFAGKCAVDQVTMAVPRGAVFALLGRNGSGKSTLIRMILGLLEPTRGSSTVLGGDSRKLQPATRGRVAYVAEGHPLIDWMRVGDLESFQKSFHPNWDADLFKNVIDHFDLPVKSRVRTLSRGQRAGVSLALALATRPELLVMDDPAMGLDPVARRSLLEAMILTTRDSGHTIFFSSHVLDDVERVADHIAILDRSVLRVSCPVDSFRAKVKRFLLAFAGEPRSLLGIPGLLQAQREGEQILLTLANYGSDAEQAIAAAGAIAVTEQPLSLEDAVIAYLGARGEQISLLGQPQAAGATR